MTIAVPLVLQLFAANPAPELPRLMVQEFTVRGVDAATAEAITDGIGPEIDKRGYFRTLTSKDVQTILGVERQKALLGCSTDASTCITELAGALGAPYVLSGTISQIGPSLQLSMQMLDVSKSQVVARSIRIARDAETLRQLLPWAVAATSIPEAPLPTVLNYGSLCGQAFALSPSALYRLSLETPPLGTWQRVSLEVSVRGTRHVRAALGGNDAQGARGKSGAPVSLQPDGPDGRARRDVSLKYPVRELNPPLRLERSVASPEARTGQQ